MFEMDGQLFHDARASSLPDGNSTSPQRPDLVLGVSLIPPGGQTRTQWINPAAFAIPANGTCGNAGRNPVRAPGAGRTQSFLPEQIYQTIAPLWIVGLGFCLKSDSGKRFRTVGWMYATQNAKSADIVSALANSPPAPMIQVSFVRPCKHRKRMIGRAGPRDSDDDSGGARTISGIHTHGNLTAARRRLGG
jgi:hypothetical protein